MRIYENNDVRVHAFDENPFLWERNFLQVGRKNPTISQITINGFIYNFHEPFLQIDVSDFIHSYIEDSISIDINGVNVWNIYFYAKQGFSPVVSELMPPSQIPYLAQMGDSPNFIISLYLPTQTGRKIEKLVGQNWIEIVEVTGEPQSVNIGDDAELVRIKNITGGGTSGNESTFDYTFDYTFRGYDLGLPLPPRDNSIYWQLQKPECNIEYLLAQWETEMGQTKTWYFQKNATVRSNDKIISIDNTSRPDGYDVRKNKLIDFTILQPRADILTRKYLADIVLSDDVFIWVNGRKEPVWIEAKNFIASEKHTPEDVILTAKFRKFETV